ncbi:MAG: hypothetical protein AB1457_11990 [Chloroflexota bacterium]|nr:MAG: hypothetical protein KatS3mg045_1566 [Bellilinea sp.]
MNWTVERIQKGVQRRWLQAQNNRRIAQLAAQIERFAPPMADSRPVVLFNASSRLAWMSLNAAFTLLSGWGLRLAGVPVVHFVCRAGMSRCQLGSALTPVEQPPPCTACIRQSEHLYRHGRVRWFDYRPIEEIERATADLHLADLMRFEWEGLPLGERVLPSLRWALRRHDLEEDEPTRFLMRQFILSAGRVAREFSRFIEENQPRAVVLFNGVSYPEAVARQISAAHGLPVVTHEVGLQPFSAFFSHGHATAYPIDVPADFELSPQQEARLNAYLEKRFQGQFSMAGIRFWQEMRHLDESLLQKASAFRQIVPVFTNVIFDTSQVHANILFRDMFAWLDEVLEIIRSHPETLFVVRAHPDEDRPGKQARQSVTAWAAQNHLTDLPNVIFIPPREYLSSYELIQRSKFVMVYNSTIGLEASILGSAVLCGGQARYTALPTVFLPESAEQFRSMAEEFLRAERVTPPPEFQRNARRFLYYQLFRASLPFNTFLEEDITPGFVRLKKGLRWQDFLPESSPTLAVITRGVLRGEPFYLPEEE